ncbi:multiple inositol polyphosphate phosphatase 1-like [Macrosteles quadrilineatus]|uniref:multiple inositol polyphosphate phosphatase 1-like n=1 Tax=Macrosteles quadrilineatus TaxID=74068 RepID=UPI0023E2BB0C|nr:multiple inositol polyphosphate phosphatase 1-like [Macrosteles quadrilineatus]XP_054282250.1 multiple inositol polyphosphate phosphatase 1-like [Macrosteles quadrilineatus]XP_054282251.1 multiple inositol polyphosphate phosphatase 1-like [Macrosteles quadrilineatus]
MRSTLPVLAICCLAVARSQKQETCYADNPNPYLNFGTKTAYEHAYNKKGIQAVPDCQPIQLWLVARHGTRWPSADDIPEFSQLNDIKNHIISNYNNNKGSLCMKDIENLKEWSFNMSPDQGDMLTKQGRQDLYLLGKRIRSYFPELLNIPYSADKFVFRHTNTSRTKESAEYFYRGVFGMSFEDQVPTLPAPIEDDRLIYPYNNCPTWDAQSSSAKEEKAKFDKSEWMNNVIYSVSQRLGFDYNLTKDNVKDIYDGCRYQKAWNVTGTSPWCAAFTKEELQVLEYGEDVKYFYKSGPGKPMNMRLACPLVKDLYTRFSAVEEEPRGNHPAAVFYFSHATMVDMVSARLGLTDDSLPLTADNFPDQMYRKFRTSNIIPFTGNVLAVLYNCARGESLQTIFYQAEDIVRYPGCSVGLCEWNYIKQRFSSFTQEPSCVDDSYCFTKGGAATVTSNIGLLVAIVVLAYRIY